VAVVASPRPSLPGVVLVSSIPWGFLRQRHHVVAEHLVDRGHELVFVESVGIAPLYRDPGYYAKGVKKLVGALTRRSPVPSPARRGSADVSVWAPVLAPPRPPAMRAINRRVLVPRLARRLLQAVGPRPVVWTYLPSATALQLATALSPSALIYDCVTNFDAVPGVPRDVASTEDELVDRADAVIVDSTFLLEKQRARRSDVVQIRPGVDFELFHRAYREHGTARPYRRLGFFGALSTLRLDVALIRELADSGYELLLIGDRQGADDTLSRHPNVRIVGPVDQAALPDLLRPLDALLIPYSLTELTQAILPAKIYECLATGKPVLATALPDLRRDFAHQVYIADDAAGFRELLARLPEQETAKRARARVAFAAENSWRSRLAQFDAVLEQALAAKRQAWP
jgi:glycosyltransferase involved in cell wall biosynthesis